MSNLLEVFHLRAADPQTRWTVLKGKILKTVTALNLIKKKIMTNIETVANCIQTKMAYGINSDNLFV